MARLMRRTEWKNRSNKRYGEYRKQFRKTYVSHQGLTDGHANFTRTSTTPKARRKQYLSV